MYTSLSAPLFTIARRPDHLMLAPLARHLLFALLCFRPLSLSLLFFFFMNSKVAIMARHLSSCIVHVHSCAFVLLFEHARSVEKPEQDSVFLYVFLTDTNFFPS